MNQKRNGGDYLSAFSKWIANLGVVPLLLFLAFLFCPALTFLASLLFLVTRVFETIFQLLSNLKKRDHLHKVSLITYLPSFFKLQVLPRGLSHVKVLATFTLYFMVTHHAKNLLASEYQALNNEHYSLAKGEIISIPLSKGHKFTVANKEVISVKLADGGSSILIKAKSLGISDLIIWSSDKSREPRHFHINVLGKRTYQKLAYHKAQLNIQSLTKKIVGRDLHLIGTIDHFESYLHIKSVQKDLKGRLVLESLSMTPSLRRVVYTKFIETLTKRGIFNLNCEILNFYISCFVTKEMKSTVEALSQNFFIQMTSGSARNRSRQFKISLTLQQFENAGGQVFSLGLDRVQTNWGDIIESNPLALIRNNGIHISKNNYKSKTIAKPQILGQLNHPINIKIGQEISYFQNNNQAGAVTGRTRQWRFAGLELNLELRTFGEDIRVVYKNSLSKPEQNTISTNGQESSILLTPGNSQILFNIGFHTNQQDLSNFPLLSQIPLLGSLFEGKSKSQTYKKILCLIKIEEL